MKKILFVILLMYLWAGTTLPIRLFLLWPSMHHDLQLQKVEGNLISGYTLDLKKNNADDSLEIERLYIGLLNSHWTLKIKSLFFESKLLKSLNTDLTALASTKNSISNFQNAKFIFPILIQIDRLNFKGGQHWPRLYCTDFIINTKQFSFSCKSRIEQYDVGINETGVFIDQPSQAETQFAAYPSIETNQNTAKIPLKSHNLIFKFKFEGLEISKDVK